MADVRIHRGVEGPKEDPYSYQEYVVTKGDGTTAILHSGLNVFIELDGHRITPNDLKGFSHRKYDHFEMKLIEEFEDYVGVTLKSLVKAEEKIHPYFEDPMGHPSQYE